MSDRALKKQKCVPYASGQPPLSSADVTRWVKRISGWQAASNKKSIAKEFRMKDFSAAIEFLRKIAQVANREDHHPDAHLTSYRKLRLELSTHSIGGLSPNDFILATKIDALPKKLKA